MIQKRLTPLLFLLFGILFVAAVSNSSGPPPSSTGAPGEQTCANRSCHGGSINTANGSVVVSISGNSTEYDPGMKYTVSVEVSDQDRNAKFGFQLTALSASNAAAGTLISINNQVALVTGSASGGQRQYVRQTSSGNNPSSSNTKVWTFEWTAPATDVGPITFYAAGLAANGNRVADSGDHTFTTTKVLNPKSVSPPVISVTNPAGLSGERCPNNAFNIDFTTTIPLQAGNSFTAQISDNMGSFANPVSIGVLNNTMGGSISANIPFIVSPASGYQIRIVSSMPVVNSTNSIPDVTVLAAPAQPMIEQNASILSVADTYTSYQWYLEGNPITGATNNTYEITQNGVYYVLVGHATNDCRRPSLQQEFLVTSRKNLVAKSSSWTVHPNPSSGIVHFTFVDGKPTENLKYQLLDALGRKILEGVLVDAQIDLSNITSGVYSLYLLDNNGQNRGVHSVILK